MSSPYSDSISKIDAIITTDAGGRGMKHLVVPGDLLKSAEILARLKSRHPTEPPHVLILTGFPCCVDHDPPTETDGLASIAIARACVSLGYEVTLLTENCNEAVFRAAVDDPDDGILAKITLSFTPPIGESPPSRLLCAIYGQLKHQTNMADLVIACERAGPASDGNCYTMRGINMTAKNTSERGLIFPLHRIMCHAADFDIPSIAIGDGGNELGMGKVIDRIEQYIENGKKVGCVIPADHLIAASVSNWGGYALIAAAALVRSHDTNNTDWVEKCMPTEESETQLLHRCVAAGCRDGVSGKMEATVDGMPLERTMQCLREVRKIALGK